MKTFINILGIVVIMTATSCRSVQKMVDNGNYDQAIALATKKMQGDRFKKVKHIKALEKAFDNVNTRSIDQINYLKLKGDLESWESINDIALDINSRQNLIAPYLPLVSKDGYRGAFDFINASAIHLEAESNIKSLAYDRGVKLLDVAKEFDRRSDAREAYYAFGRVLDLEREYKGTEYLINEAEALGKDHVLIETRLDSDIFLPYDIERYLDGISYIPTSSQWTEFYINPRARDTFDYIGTLRINDIIISPEYENKRVFHEEKEIQEGWEYVLDDNGNVAKDTFGNDIKQDKYVIAKARIKEITRRKDLELRAELELIATDDSRSFRKPINAFSQFEDFTCKIRGDRRALTDGTRKRVKEFPLEFPDNTTMLLDTVDEVKNVFQVALERMIRKISV